MKKILLILILGMFLISLVSAEISSSSGECSIGSVKQGDIIELTQVCRGGCTVVNLTKVMFPNQSIALLGEFPMTENGSNYNFTFSNIDTLGTYTYDAEGVDPNSIVVGQTCSFEVTTDGNPIQIFPYQFALIFFSFLLIFLSYFNERLNLFKYLGSIMIMTLGVITLYPGYSLINWTTFTGQLLGINLIGLGFYFLIEDSFSRKEQALRFDQNHSFKDGKTNEKKLFRGNEDDD